MKTSKLPAVVIFGRRGRFRHFFKVAGPFAVLFGAAFLSTHPALAAASSGGGSLPWETPLTTFLNSMKGPVAYGISIVALVSACATLVWGGEVTEFSRRIIYLILVIAGLALATSLYSSLFTNGAVM